MKINNIIILLIIVSIFLLNSKVDSKSLPPSYNRNNLKLPNEKDVQDIYNRYNLLNTEHFSLKQNPFKKTNLNENLNTKLQTSYPVSSNCSNAMSNLLNPNNPDFMMLFYSGVSVNELGNFDSCISYASNVSQYCLFNTQIEEILPIYIGVCYPSAIYCSPEDVLGLMTQYSILMLLQANMTFNATEDLHCYNSTYQTVKIEATAGTWAMTAVCAFIALNIIIGTVIEYIFVIQLSNYRKRYGTLMNHPYSLLNPKSYFEPNSTNLQGDNQYSYITNQNENESSGGGGASTAAASGGSTLENLGNSGINNDFEPQFYDGFFERISNVNVESNLFIKYFTCWSLIKNFNSLAYGTSEKRYFNSLDGIRTLSTCWVILGHSLLFGASGYGYDNLAYVASGTTLQTFAAQAIFGGEFAVDTFFMLSGFLVSYSVLNQLSKRNSIYGSIKFWVAYVVHRFVRLSPLYYFMIFFSMWVAPMIGSGPIFYQYSQFTNLGCSSSWWTNFLYFNNLYSTLATECYAVSWYLANDMQFFLLTPFILILFRKWKLGGWLLTLSLIFASVIGTTIVAYKYQLNTFFDIFSIADETNTNPFITDIYQKPWNRIGPYLVGILVSFIYTAPRLSKRVRFIYYRRISRYILYCIAFFVTFFLVYCPYTFYQNAWNYSQKAVFSGFGHTSFVVGLAIFMIGTFFGYGGIVKWFLELGIFKFFSKLTYSSYLVHPLVIMFRIYSMTNFLHYSVTEFIVYYAGNLATTFAAAFVIHLLIEKPFVNLERLIFSSSSSS
ncbi:hypothetical protein ACTFIW_011717 [Dictyostelium discoideum]